MEKEKERNARKNGASSDTKKAAKSERARNNDQCYG
jgi:hypothetical protein